MIQKINIAIALILLNTTLLFAQASTDINVNKKIVVIAKPVAITKWVCNKLVGNITNPHYTNELYADLQNMYIMQIWEVEKYPDNKDNGPVKAMVNPYLKLVKEITNLKISSKPNSKDQYYYEVTGVPCNTYFVVIFKCKMPPSSVYVQTRVQDKFLLNGAFFSGQNITSGSEQMIAAKPENIKITSHHVINISVEKKPIVVLH